MLLVNFCRKVALPYDLHDLQLHQVFQAALGDRWIALVPLSTVVKPVLGIKGSENWCICELITFPCFQVQEEGRYFLYTMKYLSRENWVTTTYDTQLQQSHNSNFNTFFEEDEFERNSQISELEDFLEVGLGKERS